MISTFDLKKGLLTTLYQVYEECAADFNVACTRYCGSCCTHNVLATTAEVELMVEYSMESGVTRLLAPLTEAAEGKRLRPRLTINTLADYCLRREEPPAADEGFHMAPCPLRGDSGCPIYEVRPFACRSMWSVESCLAGGEAVMPPELVTLNGVFEQMIEHVDSGGLCGNLMDLTRLLYDPKVREAYLKGEELPAGNGILVTRANPGFLVPPPHRPRVHRALESLNRKTIRGMPFPEGMRIIRNRQP